MNNVRDWHKYRHEWCKTGPSYLLSENGDRSIIFIIFFERVLSRELSGEVSKIFISNFNFWGITSMVVACLIAGHLLEVLTVCFLIWSHKKHTMMRWSCLPCCQHVPMHKLIFSWSRKKKRLALIFKGKKQSHCCFSRTTESRLETVKISKFIIIGLFLSIFQCKFFLHKPC